MKRNEHLIGVHEQYVVKRRLKLAEIPPGREEELLSVLIAMPGMARAGVDQGGRRLVIDYDASIQSLEGVLEVLKEQGVVIATDWWSRFRANWYHNTDANVHDNSHREPWSCHKDPPG